MAARTLLLAVCLTLASLAEAQQPAATVPSQGWWVQAPQPSAKPAPTIRRVSPARKASVPARAQARVVRLTWNRSPSLVTLIWEP